MKWVYSGYSTASPSSSNLIKKYDYVYSSSTEGIAWKDLLTSYDGEIIPATHNLITYKQQKRL